MNIRYREKFSAVWVALEKRLLPSYVWTSDPLTFWRERILFILCFFGVIFGPIALIPSLLLAYSEGLFGVVLIDSLTYATAVVILIARNIAFIKRALVLCFIIYALGISILFILGPVGAGYIWLFGASVLISTFIGIGASIFTLALNTIVLLSVGIFIAYGNPAWALHVNNALKKWLVMSANFLILNVFITIATAFLQNGLKKALLLEQEISKSWRESEERYRMLVENANDIIFRTDNTGHFTFVNPAALRITGYKEDEVIGMHYPELIRPDMRDEAIKFFGRQFVKEIPNTYSEYPVITKDGQEVWFGQNTQLILENDNAIYFQSVARNITDLKKAEDALHIAEKTYRNIFMNAQIGLYRTDTKTGIMIEANDKLAQAIGYNNREDLLSSNFNITERYVDQEARREVFALLKEHREINNYETRFRINTGEIRWVRFSAKLVPGKNWLEGVSEDITTNKKDEAEKKILEERLQQADKMEAIGTLAGGIAHDFNNLLMGIQGYASMTLLNLDPSNPNYERLKRIEEQVQSGADLTSQLLGFARGGRYEIKPTNINEIIEKTSSMFGRTKKEITINKKYETDLCPVEVDRGQMEQVFLNLYVNAWQAMPGGGEINLSTLNVILNDGQDLLYSLKPGKYVKITVTDTGTGMDEKTREKIFDPFFTTKEMGRGTGLGLATVYGIIKGHGGMINVESVPGQGSTFTIYLPASDKEILIEKVPTEEIVRGTETILLIDDEQMVMEVNKELLESMGYKVYVAGSGKEGIALYLEKKDEINLVILDMIMPGISGGETFDRLRKINPNIKVLLSSGYSLTGEAKEIMDRGCNGFIQKPFRMEVLSGKVRDMLD